MPKGFQRSALEMAEPPMGKSQLQQEENDTHTQTDCRTAVLVQSQSVTEIQETPNDRLHDVIGKAHSSIGHQNLLYPALPHPVKQQEYRDHGQHKTEIIPGIQDGLQAVQHQRLRHYRKDKGLDKVKHDCQRK